MEQILNQILSELKSLSERQSKLEEGQAALQQNQIVFQEGQTALQQSQGSIIQRLNSIDNELKELNRKTDIVFDQTAGLTEFTTATNNSFNQLNTSLKVIKQDVTFISHKEMENEKDVFAIKQHLEIIK